MNVRGDFAWASLIGCIVASQGEISLEKIITNANLQPKTFFSYWRVRQVDDFIIIITMIIFPPYDFAIWDWQVLTQLLWIVSQLHKERRNVKSSRVVQELPAGWEWGPVAPWQRPHRCRTQSREVLNIWGSLSLGTGAACGWDVADNYAIIIGSWGEKPI